MPTQLRLENSRFGKLVVLATAGVDRSNNMWWQVQCDCGGVKRVCGTALTSGKTQSCGCLQRQRSGDAGRSRGLGTVVLEGIKGCAKCGVKSAVTEFNNRNSSKDRKHPWCRRCIRNLQLTCKYGITLVQYETLIEKQGGCCASCGDKFKDSATTRSNPVDHDHKTGAVRSILCHFCNVALGLLREDVGRMNELILYCQRINFIVPVILQVE